MSSTPEMTPWLPMNEAPTDGTRILAALRVYHRDGRFLGWDTHIVWADDETARIHDEAYQGWDWDSYERWMPLPPPPADLPPEKRDVE